MSRFLVMHPAIKALAGIAADQDSEPGRYPGTTGVCVTTREDGRLCIEATDGRMAARFTVDKSALPDPKSLDAKFPNLDKPMPTTPPTVVVRLDPALLAVLANTAAMLCEDDMVTIEIRAAGPEVGSGDPPIVMRGKGRDGEFVALLVAKTKD
jgi:hypothetical protein